LIAKSDRDELLLGIDEAGRGPVIGPMVIAGFAIPESRLTELEELGVKDSKKLSPKKRNEIGSALRAMNGVMIDEEIVFPMEIDLAVTNRSVTLNGLEISKMAAIIDKIQADAAYIDLIGASEEKFIKSISRLVSKLPRMVCKHKADSTYLVTAAASIIAKTRRDSEIEKICERFMDRYGPLGSGYPSDAVTVSFLKSAYMEDGIFRKTWSSYKRVVNSMN